MTPHILLVILAQASAPTVPPFFREPDQPIERRVEDLVNRLTLDEKIAQLSSNAPAISRLGVAAYRWWSEGLHGVTVPEDTHAATCFPQALGMAAAWDVKLMHRVAVAISDEARARYHHQHANDLSFYAPNINLLRDPRWGRAMETYGEDPWLTVRLAVAYIRGMQGDDPRYLKVLCTAKHFAVHSGPDLIRYGFNAIASPRDIFESYLPHFKAAIVEAGAAEIMPAYTALNGQPCSMNTFLLEDVLRGQWDFTGMVVSDCDATMHASRQHHYSASDVQTAAECINAGMDMELCGTAFRELRQAVDAGLVSEFRITRACQRVFTQRFRLGEFDPPERVAYAQIPATVIGRREHRDLSLQMARESLVLLKNAGGTLPLRDSVQRVAVIGPNADDRGVMLGNYFWGKETALVSPLAGIRERLEGKAEVVYEKGSEWITECLDMKPVPASALPGGLHVDYFKSRDLSGAPALSRDEPNLDHNWLSGWALPDKKTGSFSARWAGNIRFPKSGAVRLAALADDGVRVFLDDKNVAEDWTDHSPRAAFSERINVESGRDYPLKVEYYDAGGGAMAKLLWQPEITEEPFTRAVRAAQSADAVIMLLGAKGYDREPSTEGEGYDRTIDLPEVQLDLLKAVCATGKPVVLVLLNGGPLSCVWAQEHVPAILEAWYPGQEGGTAIAEALVGDYCPGGRLPATFYRDESQLPDFGNYAMEGRTYRFFKGEPLYGFGFGLSYTTFAYDGLKLDADTLTPAKAMTVTVRVTNTGKCAGDEVVQVYARALSPTVRVPIRRLVGFDRIHLAAGATVEVTMQVRADALMAYDDEGRTFIDPGEFELTMGGTQPIREGNPGAPPVSQRATFKLRPRE